MTPTEIEREIENTRSHMADTLAQLEQKLSPQTFMDQAVDTMRNYTKSTSLQGVIRDNPVPVAILGLGLSWIAYKAYRNRQSGFDGQYSYGDETGASGLARMTNRVTNRVKGAFSGSKHMEENEYSRAGHYSQAQTNFGQQAIHDTGISVSASGNTGLRPAHFDEYADSNLAGQARHYGETSGSKMAENMEMAKERLSESYETAKSRVSEGMESARHNLQDMGQQARHYGQMAGQRTRETFQEHPISMGLAALVAGIALGALLPRSRRESELMGETAGQALTQAKNMGRDLASKASNVVERSVRAARDEGQAAYEEEMGHQSGTSPTSSHGGGPNLGRSDHHDRRYH